MGECVGAEEADDGAEDDAGHEDGEGDLLAAVHGGAADGDGDRGPGEEVVVAAHSRRVGRLLLRRQHQFAHYPLPSPAEEGMC